MYGYIYKIVNDINNKVYIGQTIQNPGKRLQGHINDAFTIDYSKMDYKYNHKFARALRKYGIEHFKIIVIEECNINNLNEKEIYYIDKYNSFKDGYNTTLGGDGIITIKFSSEEIKYIIESYTKELISIANIAKSLGVSSHTIKNILDRHDIKVRESVFESKRVVMYDKQFNPLHIFDSKKEIVDWLANNTDYAINLHSIYGLITKACQKGNTAYGFRWQLFLDLQCENKVFRTKFDKEAYLQGEKAYIPEGKDYWVVDNVLNALNIQKEKDNTKITKEKYCKYCGIKIDINRKVCDICKDINKSVHHIIKAEDDMSILKCSNCGKPITRQSKTGLCASCSNVRAKAPNKPMKPSKEELKSLLDKGLQKKQIAKMYQRSDGTVHYWIDSYGLR